MKDSTVLIALSIVVFLLAGQAVAQISPGELAAPHVSLEGISNCTKCHTLGGGPDVKKCLACHKEIAGVIDERHGYHFLVTGKQQKSCLECHSEHHGRKFELVFWPQGMDNFNHALTGYRLLGKHSRIKCRKCHEPAKIKVTLTARNDKIDLKKTFLGLQTDCLSCHEDEHRGQLAKDCLQCHDNEAWKPAKKFSHDKAKFRLTGKHLQVDCQKCHKPVLDAQSKPGKARTYTRFVGLSFANCTSCHRDIHQGKFGSRCTDCHSTAGWRQIQQGRFDHSRTRFPLLGMHKRVNCNKCHTSGDIKKPLAFARCTDCHADAHAGQFARRKDKGQCESCHDVSGFLPARFDVTEHGKTDYPLTGAHLAVPCAFCHKQTTLKNGRRGRVFVFADKTCKGCHEDVHKGQFAKQVSQKGCESCHETSDWARTKFDHNKSRFALVGKHQLVECRKCHKTVDAGTASERILFKPMQMACRSCHEDIHIGQFRLLEPKKSCDKCHSPQGWMSLLFDHNRDALFHLRGAHEKVPCADCHKQRKKGNIVFIQYRAIDRRCVGCHGNSTRTVN